MLSHRVARPDDVSLYFDWANDPVTRQQSFRSDPIPFTTHETWFAGKITDSNALLLVFEEDGQPVGQVRIEHTPAENIIGISLDQAFRGRGLAVDLLRRATTEFFERFPNETVIHAYIKPGNQASARAFGRAGFRLSGETGKFVERHPANTQSAPPLVYTLLK